MPAPRKRKRDFKHSSRYSRWSIPDVHLNFLTLLLLILSTIASKYGNQYPRFFVWSRAILHSSFFPSVLTVSQPLTSARVFHGNGCNKSMCLLFWHFAISIYFPARLDLFGETGPRSLFLYFPSVGSIHVQYVETVDRNAVEKAFLREDWS